MTFLCVIFIYRVERKSKTTLNILDINTTSHTRMDNIVSQTSIQESLPMTSNHLTLTLLQFIDKTVQQRLENYIRIQRPDLVKGGGGGGSGSNGLTRRQKKRRRWKINKETDKQQSKNH